MSTLLKPVPSPPRSTIGPIDRLSIIRILLFLTLLCGIRSAGLAQRPQGMPAIGRAYGKVLDANTGKPAEFATVAVYSARKDSLLNGTTVRPNGDFSLDKLPFGPSVLKVSFIGYKTLSKDFVLTRENMELDLGNLLLEVDAELLKEFEVTGERSSMVMQVDRRVFNVDKDLSIQGGSAVDVMKNIPGLSVDVEGNVEMRGSNPQILIDGRPTAMILEQIPAEDIERVELITNPSAAFDASSTGGILNVILKKNTKPGYNGQLQAGVGTNDRYQLGGNLNVKQGRWGFNLSYNFNTSGNITNGDTRRTDRNNGETTGFFDQDTRSVSTRGRDGGRFGVDYQVSNRSTLSLSGSFRSHDHDGDDTQDYTTSDATGLLLTQGQQINTSTFNYTGLSSQLMFRHKSPKEGKEWTTDLTYNRGSRDSRSILDLYTYGPDGTSQEGYPRTQDNLGGSLYDQLSFQADFINPINAGTKFEYGVKSNTRLDNTYLDVYFSSPTIGENVLDTALTNNYDITESINAAYFNLSQRITDRWSLMAGLRIESTWFETKLLGTDQEFSYKYPDGVEDLDKALFPSIYFVRRWADSERELQVNFSRKIGRPRHWQVVPFIRNSDPRNVQIGNPTIAPEMSNLAEANHLLPFWNGKASWLTSLYGRYTTDVITSYSAPLPSDSSILLTTYINGSYSSNMGWENVLKLDPKKGLQFTLSSTMQYTNVALGQGQGDVRNEGFNWMAKVMASYRFGSGSNWTAQVNGEYESPEIEAQGTRLAQYGMDISLGHDFTKKLTGVVSVNDVFYTRVWGSTIDTPYLYQESFRRREQRFIRFTLTWKFGEQRSMIFRKRGSQPGREPGSGGDDGEM